MLTSLANMGIFDRFSRLVRAELNHRIGRRKTVDPASWRASEPRPMARPEPAKPSLSVEVTRAFQTLGLDPSASRRAARAAYLAELKAHHPDRHQDDEAARERATEESARMNEAWDVLERYYDAQPNSTT